ncbi:MAG: hypothetical protein HYY76_08780 [Acidobacteria bacterium]|nr:hypothetical protein [Acidobacteriota bacterium]
MNSQRPKEGDEKNCVTCGQPAIFHERALKRPQMPPVGNPATAYWPTPGWVCTVNEDHFEPA